jgi:aldehyde:ferredoxin oxidoreductase
LVNTYLHLNLTTGEQRGEPVTGWSGPLHALAHLRRAISGPVHPGDPRLPVALVTSTVAGLGGVGTARCAAVGISPLSGRVAETRAEGPFAAGLRAAGITGISLTGSATTASYVLVEGGRAVLRPAPDLWGLDTRQATAALSARHGQQAAIAVVGPAAEAGTRYATILTAGSFPLPRLGFGTLLAARRIKAIVCLPDGPGPLPRDPAAVDALTSAYRQEMLDHPLAGWQHAEPGFGAWPGADTAPGHAAVRNYADTVTVPSTWPGLHPGRFAEHLSWTSGGCPGCPNDCVKGYAGAGLHQEAVAMLGPNLGIGDLATVLAANARCQDLGLDPVSLGGVLGCLFEAAQLGALPRWLAKTLPAGVGFGEPGLLLELVELAAQPGHPLGGGAADLAAGLGQPQIAMVSAGVELPPFDPRSQPGLGLMYAAAPIGPRYDTVEHDLDFDPVHGLPHSFPEARRLGLTVPASASTLDFDRTVRLADVWSGLDALLLCPYASTPTRPLSLDRIVSLVKAVTGVDGVDVFALGRERFARQQEINDLLGVGPGTLPDRFFTEPVQEGPHRGAVVDRAQFAAAVGALHALWRAS